MMMDEIHIKPYLDYKGGTIVGSSAHSTEPATAAHVFMIQSLLSPNKDVIHILPVSKLSADVFHEHAKHIILSVEKIGLKVIAVITDNNVLNRKMMSFFATSPQSHTPNHNRLTSAYTNYGTGTSCSISPPIDLIMKETRMQADFKRTITLQGLALSDWDNQRPIQVHNLLRPMAPWTLPDVAPNAPSKPVPRGHSMLRRQRLEKLTGPLPRPCKRRCIPLPYSPFLFPKPASGPPYQ
ncbi:hypothetical protein HPB48_015728 [Haemaphysalis longicornis]|uniref:Transposable element P transposase-like RNase H domain-containing protein n=1 Tax=Haemaphysalis longicornis TaxID=44386 RepID=A0A9J6GIH2_HAELO|nr:hypothetical protein HPB48_015728 [Haemaphysalis longicornis]